MFIIDSITSNIINITTNMTTNTNIDSNNTNDNDDNEKSNDSSNNNLLDQDKDRYGFFLNDDHHKSLSMSPDINNSRKLKEAERY